MASPKYEMIFLYDANTGAPLPGVTTLAFDTYKDDLGNALTEPAIVELPGGDGSYGFIPVFADPDRGIRYIIDSGDDAAIPRRSARYMRPEDWNTDNISVGGGGTVQFYSNGDTVAPIIIQVSTPRNNQVKVTFSEPMTMTTNSDGALNPANYSISPSISIYDVTQLTSQQVMLTTETQAPNNLYTLTVVNVTDIHGVPIA